MAFERQEGMRAVSSSWSFQCWFEQKADKADLCIIMHHRSQKKFNFIKTCWNFFQCLERSKITCDQVQMIHILLTRGGNAQFALIFNFQTNVAAFAFDFIDSLKICHEKWYDSSTPMVIEIYIFQLLTKPMKTK